jgi:hypothetical protein
MNKKRVSPSAFYAIALLLALLSIAWSPAFAPSARADEGDPSVTIITKTEHIDVSATSFVVPVAFNDGTHDISSVGFLLDYDQNCVRIDSTDADITGKPSGFVSQFEDNRDTGTLKVSIWHNNTQVALTTGTLFSIRFTLEAACRQGPANLTDPTTVFSFADPQPTFGSTLGGNIGGSGTGGTYTLDLNQAPTAINVADLAMTENVVGDRKIGTLSATDSDNAPADTHTFALSGACGEPFDNQGFALDPGDSADLRSDLVFNDEGIPDYTICLQVSDAQGGVYTQTLTLEVVNANDTPSDVALSANTVAQGATAGTTVGLLSTTDEDPGQTFTYTLLETGAGSEDFAKFLIEGSALKINSPVDYTVQPEYRVRVEATDNGTPNKSVAKQFRVLVNGVSTLLLPTEPDLPSVVAGEKVTVPVSLAPNGNNVLSASFQITYNETCLDFVELANIQGGFSDGDTDTEDDGFVDVSLTTAGQAPLAKGAPVSLVFEGSAGCAPQNAWTTLGFSALPTMTGAGNVSFATAKNEGRLVVLSADAPGDCNADGLVNAGDFSATALEVLDAESTDVSGNRPNPTSWLWTPLGDEDFSARGCDSNADRTMVIADLQCTVRLFFGASCTSAMRVAGVSAPAIVMSPSQVRADKLQAVRLPLELETNEQDVSAFAATITFDPEVLKLDAADNDGDGLPDAVHFNLPAGMYRLAAYDAAAGRIDLVATGIVMPLPKLSDGVLLTLDLQAMEGADGAVTAITLTNLSLGDSLGGTVPVIAEHKELLTGGGRVFLPSLMH